MVFFELCPSDNWIRDGFNEVSSTLSESLVGALTKLTQQQYELKQQQTDSSNRVNTLNVSNNQNRNARNNSFHPQQTYNYRFNNQGRFPDEDLTIEDEDSAILEDEVDSITTEATSIVIKTKNNYNSHSNYNTPQIQESTDREHIAERTYSKQVCYICGYPNNYARGCNQRRPAKRNQQKQYQTAPKNDWSDASKNNSHERKMSKMK